MASRTGGLGASPARRALCSCPVPVLVRSPMSPQLSHEQQAADGAAAACQDDKRLQAVDAARRASRSSGGRVTVRLKAMTASTSQAALAFNASIERNRPRAFAAPVGEAGDHAGRGWGSDPPESLAAPALHRWRRFGCWAAEDEPPDGDARRAWSNQLRPWDGSREPTVHARPTYRSRCYFGSTVALVGNSPEPPRGRWEPGTDPPYGRDGRA